MQRAVSQGKTASKAMIVIAAVSQELSTASSLLPQLPYDRAELDEIIEELPCISDSKDGLNNDLATIESQITNMHRCKTKPENFYRDMHKSILEICDIVDAISYNLTKWCNSALPQVFRPLFLWWIDPLDKDLDKPLDMLLTPRAELEHKTKRLYAKQNFISRSTSQQKLMEHLGKLKQLFIDSLVNAILQNFNAASVYINMQNHVQALLQEWRATLNLAPQPSASKAESSSFELAPKGASSKLAKAMDFNLQLGGINVFKNFKGRGNTSDWHDDVFIPTINSCTSFGC